MMGPLVVIIALVAVALGLFLADWWERAVDSLPPGVHQRKSR